MKLLNGIIGRRNNQSFFSVDCAAVKEEGWGESKAWRFWSSMVATLCSSPGFSAIALSGRNCSLRHSSLLRSGVLLRTRFLKTKKFCKVRCIIALLAPFGFAISLLHPQGRDSLKFLKRHELCGFCQLGRSHGSTGLGLQFAYADQTILCLFCAVQGAYFEQSRALFFQIRPESCNSSWGWNLSRLGTSEIWIRDF